MHSKCIWGAPKVHPMCIPNAPEVLSWTFSGWTHSLKGRLVFCWRALGEQLSPRHILGAPRSALCQWPLGIMVSTEHHRCSLSLNVIYRSSGHIVLQRELRKHFQFETFNFQLSTFKCPLISDYNHWEWTYHLFSNSTVANQPDDLSQVLVWK